jgi:hypothetical protein
MIELTDVDKGVLPPTTFQVIVIVDFSFGSEESWTTLLQKPHLRTKAKIVLQTQHLLVRRLRTQTRDKEYYVVECGCEGPTLKPLLFFPDNELKVILERLPTPTTVHVIESKQADLMFAFGRYRNPRQWVEDNLKETRRVIDFHWYLPQTPRFRFVFENQETQKEEEEEEEEEEEMLVVK